MTMNAIDIGKLLGKVASFDLRTTGPADIIAWGQVLGDLDYGDCELAVLAHYRDSRERIMPADIRSAVKAIQAERLERSLVPPPPHELTDNPAEYIRALRQSNADAASARPAIESGRRV